VVGYGWISTTIPACRSWRGDAGHDDAPGIYRFQDEASFANPSKSPHLKPAEPRASAAAVGTKGEAQAQRRGLGDRGAALDWPSRRSVEALRLAAGPSTRASSGASPGRIPGNGPNGFHLRLGLAALRIVRLRQQARPGGRPPNAGARGALSRCDAGS